MPMLISAGALYAGIVGAGGAWSTPHLAGLHTCGWHIGWTGWQTGGALVGFGGHV